MKRVKISYSQSIRPLSNLDLFLAPLVQGNTLTTRALLNQESTYMDEVDVHFSDVRSDFAMDACAIHTRSTCESLRTDTKQKCAPDKYAQVVRSPSWSTCFTVCTDICKREKARG